MKKLAIIIVALMSSLFIQGQTIDSFTEINIKDVPKEVRKTFQGMKDGISADRWGVYDNRYQATIKEDKHIKYYHFNDEGLYVEKLVRKNWENAPQKLKDGKSRIQQKYWNVNEFYERTTDDGSISYYMVLQSDSGELKTVYFDSDGNFNEKSFSGY